MMSHNLTVQFHSALLSIFAPLSGLHLSVLLHSHQHFFFLQKTKSIELTTTWWEFSSCRANYFFPQLLKNKNRAKREWRLDFGPWHNEPSVIVCGFGCCGVSCFTLIGCSTQQISAQECQQKRKVLWACCCSIVDVTHLLRFHPILLRGLFTLPFATSYQINILD